MLKLYYILHTRTRKTVLLKVQIINTCSDIKEFKKWQKNKWMKLTERILLHDVAERSFDSILP